MILLPHSSVLFMTVRVPIFVLLLVSSSIDPRHAPAVFKGTTIILIIVVLCLSYPHAHRSNLEDFFPKHDSGVFAGAAVVRHLCRTFLEMNHHILCNISIAKHMVLLCMAAYKVTLHCYAGVFCLQRYGCLYCLVHTHFDWPSHAQACRSAQYLPSCTYSAAL